MSIRAINPFQETLNRRTGRDAAFRRLAGRWIALAALFWAASAIADEISLDRWLALNEPRVRTYLSTLKPSQIGRSIAGTKLSDGKRELKGYRYMANLSNSALGLRMYKFGYQYRGYRFEVHYIWVARGFPEHDLNAAPSCAGEWIVPGGWAVLSGDQYTYQAVQPGGNVVVTTCQVSVPKSGSAGS